MPVSLEHKERVLRHLEGQSLREQIAKAICNSQKGRNYDALAEFAKDWWRQGADAVLALPALASLRADQGEGCRS